MVDFAVLHAVLSDVHSPQGEQRKAAKSRIVCAEAPRDLRRDGENGVSSSDMYWVVSRGQVMKTPEFLRPLDNMGRAALVQGREHAPGRGTH